MNTSLKQLSLSLCAISAFGLANANDLQVQSRIVGGQNIDISVAPATVALLNTSRLAQTGSYYQSQFCGGTVIGSRWVLTAAHCLFDADNRQINSADLTVLMGSTDLELAVNQPVGVSRIKTHERWNGEPADGYDIALLELEYDALVNPAPLETQPTVFNDAALIAGWGALNEADQSGIQYTPTHLQGALVRLIPGEQCGMMFPGYDGYIDSRQICAARAEGGVDSCQGDSGGPIYAYNENDNAPVLRLAGITSWGVGCARPEFPGIYTRVAAFTDWINSNMGSSSSTVPVNSSPVQTAPELGSSQPANDAPVSENLFATDGGGASGWFMLPIMGTALWMRRRSAKAAVTKHASDEEVASERADDDNQDLPGKPLTVSTRRSLRYYPMALAATVLGLSAVAFWAQQSAAQESSHDNSLSLDQLQIGAQRSELIPAATQLWQQDPVCTLVKTGFGMSKRAYFLETCTFSSTAANTICGATPTWAEYRFLENKLVQVSLEFDEMSNPEDYRDCIAEQAKSLENSDAYAATVTSEFRTTLSDTDAVSQIHLKLGSL